MCEVSDALHELKAVTASESLNNGSQPHLPPVSLLINFNVYVFSLLHDSR